MFHREDNVLGFRMTETPEGWVVAEILDGSVVDGSLKVGLIILSIAEKDVVRMSRRDVTSLLDRSKGMVEIITCRGNEQLLPQEEVIYDLMLGEVDAKAAAEADRIAAEKAAAEAERIAKKRQLLPKLRS